MKDATRITNIMLKADHSAVIVLDQRRLPHEESYCELTSLDEMADAITQLMVRGAPAIGIAAGYFVYVLSRNLAACTRKEFNRRFTHMLTVLGSTRPTAVNLRWALQRMRRVAEHNPELSVGNLLPLLYAEACSIQAEDAAMCKSIAGYGLSLLREGMGILTHCNAGPLATSAYGTALGPIILGTEQGMKLHVYADETRPLLQGARLTAYELMNYGIDVTLICDNMASLVMRRGLVQICFVGCDRIAANGDTANKIGTSQVAILARYYNIPFYVLGPSSSIDLNCATGAQIPIEEREASEITSKFYARPTAPAKVKCYNPAFDITDAGLITGIITEQGICYPPYEDSLAALHFENK